MSVRVRPLTQDDIQRATDLAYRSVAEFGLSERIGPMSVPTLANGRGDDSLFGREGGGETALIVEQEARNIPRAALCCRASTRGDEAPCALFQRLDGLQRWFCVLQSDVCSKEHSSAAAAL